MDKTAFINITSNLTAPNGLIDSVVLNSLDIQYRESFIVESLGISSARYPTAKLLDEIGAYPIDVAAYLTKYEPFTIVTNASGINGEINNICIGTIDTTDDNFVKFKYLPPDTPTNISNERRLIDIFQDNGHFSKKMDDVMYLDYNSIVAIKVIELS